MAAMRRRLVLSRPVDKSFEAYKSWIANTYGAMTGTPAGEMDEEELRQDWQNFWGDQTPDPSGEPPSGEA
jgi:hypothetical protein